MKNEQIKDERIQNQKMKIQSDAYQILMLCLLVSMLIQQFLLKAPFSQFAVEFFCFFGISLYLIIRYLYEGIDIWGFGKSKHIANKKSLLSVLVCGVVCILVYVILTGEKNLWNIFTLLLIITAVYFAQQIGLRFLIRHKQKQINDAFDAEENEDN